MKYLKARHFTILAIMMVVSTESIFASHGETANHNRVDAPGNEHTATSGSHNNSTETMFTTKKATLLEQAKEFASKTGTALGIPSLGILEKTRQDLDLKQKAPARTSLQFTSDKINDAASHLFGSGKTHETRTIYYGSYQTKITNKDGSYQTIITNDNGSSSETKIYNKDGSLYETIITNEDGLSEVFDSKGRWKISFDEEAPARTSLQFTTDKINDAASHLFGSGKIHKTITRNNGATVVTKTNKDGSSETKTTQKDGSSKTIITNKDDSLYQTIRTYEDGSYQILDSKNRLTETSNGKEIERTTYQDGKSITNIYKIENQKTSGNEVLLSKVEKYTNSDGLDVSDFFDGDGNYSRSETFDSETQRFKTFDKTKDVK